MPKWMSQTYSFNFWKYYNQRYEFKYSYNFQKYLWKQFYLQNQWKLHYSLKAPAKDGGNHVMILNNSYKKCHTNALYQWTQVIQMPRNHRYKILIRGLFIIIVERRGILLVIVGQNWETRGLCTSHHRSNNCTIWVRQLTNLCRKRNLRKS